MHELDDLATLERELPNVIRPPGPTFVTLKVTPDALDRRLPRRPTKDALREVWATVEARA